MARTLSNTCDRRKVDKPDQARFRHGQVSGHSKTGRCSMVRKHWSPAILGMALMILIATASSLVMRQGADASVLAQVNPTATPVPVPLYYNYTVKFVCGYQPRVDIGEPTVKPGNYATE